MRRDPDGRRRRGYEVLLLPVAMQHHAQADPHFSAIEPVEVLLTHELDQFLCVVRAGGVTGLVDLTGERIWIILELQRASIAPIAEEKPGMFGDALLETVVFGEIG